MVEEWPTNFLFIITLATTSYTMYYISFEMYILDGAISSAASAQDKL